MRALAFHTQAMPYCLAAACEGWLLASLAGLKEPSDGAVEEHLKKIVSSPDYRDMISQQFRARVWLLGAWLVYKGLKEQDSGLKEAVAARLVGEFIVDREDALQRLPPVQPLPSPEDISRFADEIWSNNENEVLNRQNVLRVIGLCRDMTAAREDLVSRLRTLAAVEPFPGTCTRCRR